MDRRPPMRWTDYVVMSVCYALTALLAWMVYEPVVFAAYLIGLMP